MKRSEINAVVSESTAAFARHGWALPPEPVWDVTDFGLGEFSKHGLVLVNLAEEPEYCEKLMYARRGQDIPMHWHRKKKEDIICRFGELAIQFPEQPTRITLRVNSREREIDTASPLMLSAGERVTLPPGVKHAFWSCSEYAIIGEVSTANDDDGDNFFEDPGIGRFSEVNEDEPPLVPLVGESLNVAGR